MASFFSNLFRGGAEREAADRNRNESLNYYLRGSDALNRGLTRSEDALRSSVNSANAWQGQSHGLYGELGNTGNAILDRGRANSLAALGRAGAAYDPLAALGTKYGRGTDLYLDSLGLRGAEGNQRAVDAFQAGPGYAFTLDQGLQALNRRRAAAGMLNSGNADIDALSYGTGLANQSWGAWQDRLGGMVDPELTATSGAATGRAGVARDIANVHQQDASSRLGLAQGVTAGQAGANAARGANDVALGNSLAGLYTGDATNRVGLAGNLASGNMAASNLQAQGEAQGSRNLLNGIMNGALTLASLGGGGSFGFGGSPLAQQGAFGRSQIGPTFANAQEGTMGGVPFPIFRR